MSHIIQNKIGRTIEKSYAAVKVEVKGDKLIVQEGSIGIVKPETLITELPKKYKVYSSEGEEISSTKGFYITLETINPYHFILDM